jgi:hypothetical protein
MKKYLVYALTLGFLFIGYVTYQKSVPVDKASIYKEIRKYSPYYMDRRLGGLTILSKSDENFKEKPLNIEVFHRLDELERLWGQKYLKISDSQVLIMNDDNKTVAKIPITTQEDRTFINTFYGL